MQDFIAQIIAKFGIPEQLARMAVGLILGNLKSAGPADLIGQLFDKIPGADALVEEAGKQAESQDSGGGLGGMLAGAAGSLLGGSDGGAADLMKTLSSLQSAGLEADQVKSIGGEVINFAKEQAGDDLVDQITSQIPGLNQLL